MPKSPLAATVLLAAVALPLAACSSDNTPPPALTAAQAAYGSAANDPAVVRQAPLELQQAREALAQSEQLWRSDADREDVAHAAYLAHRRAEIAQQTAALKTAQDQVQHADAAHAQALLGARTAEAQQAQQRAERLQQQLQALKSDQANRGPVVLTLGDILFDVDKATLKPGAYDTIAQVADFLKSHPERTVAIEGYTDSTGSAAHNQQLSQARADAVRSALLQQGVTPSRVAARGFGESAPIATNGTTAGRQLNRRVEVAISGPQGQMPQASSGTSSPR